jgi:hypothetical protein
MLRDDRSIDPDPHQPRRVGLVNVVLDDWPQR